MKGDDAQVGQQPEKERNECTRLHGVQGGKKEGGVLRACVCASERESETKGRHREKEAMHHLHLSE